jgi:hypothetical protein
MNKPAVSLVVALCLPVSLSIASAQSKPSPVDGASKTTTSTKKRLDPLAEQKRTTVVSLLSSLADEAKSFQDKKLRVRVLAQTADALWEANNGKAVTLFRRAWTEAGSADSEAANQAREDARRQQQSQRGAVVRRRQPDVRGEVLRLVAKRDRSLGEEFLKQLDDEQKREASDATSAKDQMPSDAWSASLSDAKRLNLASQLLQSGDVDRALLFADPALVRVNRETIFFLSDLRRKNAPAADQRFAALLSMVAVDPMADANTISGLSSYVFTPFLYFNFAKDGGAYTSQRERAVTPPDISPRLRDAFMSLAAQILLRPLAPPDQDQTTSGRVGKYMIIKRLLPLFERYLPDAFAELNSTLAALSSDMPGGRDRLDENNSALTRGIIPEDPNKDFADRMQDRLDHAKDATERDAIYADYAVAAAGKKDPRARELADKIEDSELRKQVRNYADFETIRRLLDDGKDIGEALRIARQGELTHYQRAWAFTQASRIMTKQDRVRATEVLQDALTEARKIGDGETSESVEADRARAFVAIASRFAELDKTRAWELMNEVVKTTNAAQTYTGQDSQIGAMVHTKFMTVAFSSSVEDFDLSGLFRNLAEGDLYRAIETVHGLSAESTRSAATLAVARSVLEPKS